jgi:hypothetical protein
MIATSKEVQ